MKAQCLNSEYGECCALADYLELLKHQGKVLAYTHIPNETYTTSWNQKNKNKRQGVHKGFPDYAIILRHNYSALDGNKLPEIRMLFIEMKKTKGGTVSPEQRGWIESIRMTGNIAEICKGFDEAKQFIQEYL